jgi:hypothetical protein
LIRSREDVDAGDGVEGDGDVEVEVAGLGVVDAEAVQEDEGLLEGGAAEGKVSLNAVGGAGLEVEGGVLAEEVDDGVGDERLVARGDEVDGAIAFGEREGFKGGGDRDALGDGGLRGRWLSKGGGAIEEADCEEGFHGSAVTIVREILSWRGLILDRRK